MKSNLNQQIISQIPQTGQLLLKYNSKTINLTYNTILIKRLGLKLV